MNARPICIYHADCTDGFAAAWAVWRRFKGEVDFVPGYYQRALPEDEGFWKERNVLIVDFSFPKETLENLARVANAVLVLDHHKSAREQLRGIMPPMLGWDAFLSAVESDRRQNIGRTYLRALFDMDRSGAGLAWDYLFGSDKGQTPRSPLVSLVEDRDLWRFQYETSRAFHAVAAEVGFTTDEITFSIWNNWHEWSTREDYATTWRQLLSQGEAVVRAERKLVESAVKASLRYVRLEGEKIPVANVPGRLASEAGNYLVETHPEAAFVATYYDAADGRRHFSLRSGPNGADVSKVAAAHGGGGHAHAAGFNADLGWEG